MADAPAVPAKKGMSKNTKTILIVLGVVVVITLAALGYYFFIYKPKQLKGLPTSKDGLASGAKWNNNGKIEVVP